MWNDGGGDFHVVRRLFLRSQRNKQNGISALQKTYKKAFEQKIAQHTNITNIAFTRKLKTPRGPFIAQCFSKEFFFRLFLIKFGFSISRFRF